MPGRRPAARRPVRLTGRPNGQMTGLGAAVRWQGARPAPDAGSVTGATDRSWPRLPVTPGRPGSALGARPRRRRSAGRRGGSGPGPCRAPGPAARSAAGAASPCRAARRPAPGGPAPRRRAGGPAGVSAGSTLAVEVGGQDRRGRHPDTARGRAARRRARASALRSAVTVGEDQHQPGVRARRRQMAVEERLEVAVGRRQPRRLLDLEDELAAGRPVRAGRDDQQVGRVGRAGRRSARRRPRRAAPAARIARRRIAVERPSRQVRPDRRRRQHRAQVADGVAPALVELLGLDDEVGQRRTRRPPGDRDERRPGAGGPRGGQRRVRRASCRPRARRRSRSPVGGGSSASSKAWAATRRPAAAGRPRAPPRAGCRRSPSAACSEVPQPVTTTGWPAAAVVARPPPPAPPPGRRRRPGAARIRRASAGSAAIMSVMWYGGPERGLGRIGRGPRIGRAGEGSGRIEGGVGASSSAEDRRGAAGRRAAASPRGRVTIGREPRTRHHGDDGGVRRRRDRMQVGLMAPQGWKGEYDGWDAADAWARTVELARAGRGARLRVAVGLRPLPHGAAPDRRDHLRGLLGPHRPRDGDRRGSASATWSSARGSATRPSRPSSPRRSTSSAAAASSSASGPAGRRRSGGPTATASRRSVSGWARWATTSRSSPGCSARAARPTRATYAHVRGAINVPKGIQTADPDHRRRQRRAADRRLRHQVRRRAQLRLPRGRRDRRAHGERPRAMRERGPRSGHAAVLALHPRRSRARRRARRGSTYLGRAGRDRPRPGRRASRRAGIRPSRRRPSSPRTAGRPA